MTLHPPVVVAVGRNGSPDAIDLAASEARRLDRGLHLVHATRGAAHLEEGHALLAAASRRAHERVSGLVPVTTVLSADPPLVALLATADRAALVVVGRSTVRPHPYVRSVTGGVADRVHVPVLAVPDGWRPRPDVARVVVGFDEGANCGEALVEAFAAARARGAGLSVVATWWRPTRSTHDPLTQVRPARGPDEVAAAVDRSVASLRAWYAEVPVDVSVLQAPAGEALLAASDDADLIVLGRHEPMLPAGSHLGPVARAVLREARCPVLLATPVDAHHVRPPSRTTQPA